MPMEIHRNRSRQKWLIWAAMGGKLVDGNDGHLSAGISPPLGRHGMATP